MIEPFDVATLVGDSVIAKQVYRNCLVVIYSHHTIADLIELYMTEFDIIMGINWLASCYTILWLLVDYREKAVRFRFPRGKVEREYNIAER